MSSSDLNPHAERRTSQMPPTIRWLVVGVLWIGSCTAPAATPAPPTLAPPAVPTEPPPAATSIPIAPDPWPSSRAVLAACDSRLQSRAMRASQVPDWNTLGLNACYELTLELLRDEQSYTGTARVTFANLTSGNLPDVVFRAYPNAPIIYGGTLDITSAQVDGTAVTPEVFLTDRTAVRLPLPRPLAEGAAIIVELTFEGHLPRDFGSRSAYGIFNYSDEEPLVSLANWFPILAVRGDDQWQATPVIGEGDAVVSEIALYRVRISAPADWKVAATGTLLDSKTNGATTHYDFAGGAVRDFNVLASPAFEVREARLDGVRIVHWGLAGGESGWDEALEVARASLEIFDVRFGAYPYAELDVVAVPLQNAAGVEYPGLILIEAGLYPGAGAGQALAVTVAHEVAHQWWYAVVGSDVLLSPWQDEALTTFSSSLYFEENLPPLYRALLAFYRRGVEAYQAEQGDEPIAQPLDAFRGRGQAYGTIVYLKGALFFEAVRDRIGDDAFFGALQAYYTRNRYRLVGPEALLAAFEQSCACELDTLYAEWGVATP